MSIRYAVIGDSIQWGQGLWEKDKFSSLVEDELERRYGISAVCVARYAHSAASLGSNGNSASKNAARTDLGDYSGEVPFDSATIYSQLNTLEAFLDDSKDNLDLLLVDGGINPDPFGILINPGGSVEKLGNATWAACHETMGKFLGDAATKFPKAHIVVTGYYPIFSAESAFSDVGVFVAGMLTAVGFSTGAITEVFGAAAFTNLIKLSTVWGEESADALRKAVSDTGSSRVSYAHVDFGPQNCLFAPSHWLWGFGSLPPLPGSGSFGWDELLGWVLTLFPLTTWLRLAAPADPVRNEREKFCGDLDKIGDKLFCDWASVGHPNKTGAKKYCDAIMQALEDTGFDPNPTPKWIEPIFYLSMRSSLGADVLPATFR